MKRQKTRPTKYGAPAKLPLHDRGLSLWRRLDAKRSVLLRRYEGFASVTIPKVCLPPSAMQGTESLQHSWSSVGAQCVNHITNKLLINLFRPGMSFFRLDPNKKLGEQLADAGITESDLRDSLVKGEMTAMQQMDQQALRPQLFEGLRALVVVGNALLDTSDDDFRIHSIRNYVVQRAVSGRPIKILIHERLLFSELADKVREALPHRDSDEHNVDSAYVSYVRSYVKCNGKWEYTQHVDETMLGDEFSKTYTDATLPVFPLVWDRADEHDYGTGLVEDYAGDFGTLDTLSESEIKAAILASDFRWLLNPAGGLNVDDFKNTRAGDAIPGTKDDLQLVSLVGQSALQGIQASVKAVVQRLGMAFLLGSAITRDAERVTAEEIRMQAQELETSLGGVYSRLAVDLQLPVALFLLDRIGVQIRGTNLVPSVVTGLAALSRNAEAQSLAQFLQQLATLGTMPDSVGARLQLTEVISTLAAAYGISASKYVKSEKQVAAEQAQAQQMAVNNQATVDASKAGAQALANRNSQE